MNGIDTEVWDPARDAHLPPPMQFDAASCGEGKAAAKALLQELLGLELAPDVPLIGFIGRCLQCFRPLKFPSPNILLS